jgi:hypothetical protein
MTQAITVSEMTVSPLALQLRADPMTSTKALCRSEYHELVKGPRKVDQHYDDDEDPERDEASQRRSQIVVEFFLDHERHHTSRSLVCQGVCKVRFLGGDKADSGNGEGGQPFLAHDAERWRTRPYDSGHAAPLL